MSDIPDLQTMLAEITRLADLDQQLRRDLENADSAEIIRLDHALDAPLTKFNALLAADCRLAAAVQNLARQKLDELLIRPFLENP